MGGRLIRRRIMTMIKIKCNSVYHFTNCVVVCKGGYLIDLRGIFEWIPIWGNGLFFGTVTHSPDVKYTSNRQREWCRILLHNSQRW